jgi:hypothetical protein
MISNKRVRVLPYKQGSKGAKALADALGGRVLKLEGSKFRPKDSDVIINWGNSSEASRATINNDGDKLANATNKLEFFRKLEGKPYLPLFWTSPNDIPEDAFPVVCRTILQGHSGAGIVVAADRSSLVPCSLYTKYVKKKDEYRVHVGRKLIWVGDNDHEPENSGWQYNYVVISLQQKKRRLEHPDPNWQVRNHANGFIYARSEVKPPDEVIEVAKDTLLSLDLDFGAVDVIWNNHEKKAYVLEINTAPGLEGSTVKDYKEFFQNA